MGTDRNTAIKSSQIFKHTLQLDDISPDSLVWQEPVEDKDLTTPPGSPSEEVRYLIISGGSGTDWAGQDNKITQYVNSVWVFYTPQEGWLVWVKDENKLYIYNGSSWSIYTGGISSDDIDDFTIKLSNNKLKIADRIELNQALLFFYRAIDQSESIYSMVDGLIDEFEDESGIDTGASTNENYDSVNDLYRPIASSLLELDYMEYANDGAAQAAYVTSSLSEVVDQQQTTVNGYNNLGDQSDSEKRVAQSFILSGAKTVTAVEIHQGTVNGSPTGNWTLRIETDSSGLPSGTLAHVNASVVVAPPGAANTVKGTFASSFGLSAATTYWLVVQCDNQSTNNFWRIGDDEPTPTYAFGVFATSSDGGSSWATASNTDLYFKIYVDSGALDLQCYSEATIKNQGSYSLKAIATITDSLNETLTKSGLSIDLSGNNSLKFWVYSSRTGTNLQLQIHDSGGTTSTKNILISSADTWTEITWDISAISDANKDDIDSIIIKIINADSANTFYIDNFYNPGVTSNMTLISNSEVAESAPSDARIVLFEEDVDSITENTDLKAYVSRDGGSTYAQVTLSDEGDYETGKRILTGVVDLTQSGVGSGTNMEYKIETLNNKELKLHGVGLHWD